MIRVLHINASMNRGGIETLLMNVYRRIDRDKVQFDFLLHTSEKCAYDDEIIALGGRIYNIPPRHQGFKKNREAIEAFFKEHPEYKIVHQHVSSLSYVQPLKTASKLDVPVRIIHSHNTREGGSKFHKLLHLWNRIKLEEYATNYFACSETAALWLYGKRRFNKNKYTILNNGIDTTSFAFSSESREKLRNEFGIKSNQILVGHVGRFQEQKNHEFLLDIFSEINKINVDSVLLLVGDGSLRRNIQEKAKLLGLENKIIFAGVRSDTPELYSAMDVFVLPSHHEGLPVVLVEAQTSGLPCIVTKDAIPPEAKLLENFVFVPLEHPANVWADIVLSALNGGVRTNKHLTVLEKGYDICQAAEQLQTMYQEVQV